MPTERPLALLSNDDGIQSRGLEALRDALVGQGFQVVVVAPSSEQSAASHALTLHRPLRLEQRSETAWAVDGTPADCVYVALHGIGRILPREPDVVASGLNFGPNLGQDVFYSGTVAAAREGALRGIPSIAASAHVRTDFALAARLAARIADRLVGQEGTAKDRAPLVNLNVPNAWNGDVRRAHLGARIYDGAVDFRQDPRGREYFWIGGPGVRHEDDPGSDTEAFDAGTASLTMLRLNLTEPRLDAWLDDIVTGIKAGEVPKND